MKVRSFIQLHIAVFLFSFTAILGDLIQLPTVALVWWRVFLSIWIMALILGPKKLFISVGRLLWLRHIFVGFLVAIHWLAFYGTIKISNASIVLIAASTTSFITALIEPILIKSSKWRSFDLLISILVIPAMVMIYYNADSIQQNGLWLGLFASLVGAVFSVLNKMWIEEGKEMEISFIQQLTIGVSLSILLAFMHFFDLDNGFSIPRGIDWFYMLIFAGVCTVWAYYLYLRSMHKLSAFDVSFAFNMEPVYGLILAALILSDYEEISLQIYLGIAFVLLMVGVHTYLKSRKKEKSY